MLGIKGNMVPVFPSVLILQAGGIAPFFFLVNKGPLLIKLNLFGLGGESDPTSS